MLGAVEPETTAERSGSCVLTPSYTRQASPAFTSKLEYESITALRVGAVTRNAQLRPLK